MLSIAAQSPVDVTGRWVEVCSIVGAPGAGGVVEGCPEVELLK
jgi:hypothetical protein